MRTFLCAVIVISVICFSCSSQKKKDRDDKQKEAKKSDSLKGVTDSTLILPRQRPEIRYKAVHIDKVFIKHLKDTFNADQLNIVMILNRIHPSLVWRTDTLIVPDTFLTELMDYSPFPDMLPVAKDIYKLLLISYPIQAFGAYEKGKLIRWGPASLGKKSTLTPAGLFFTNWKSKETVSTDDSTWILKWYFNLINSTGVSIHQYGLPGYPASHACARFYEEDAKWFYSWANQWMLTPGGDSILAYGTPVIIYGSYPFGHRRPWYSLVEDAKSNDQSTDSLSALLNPYLPLIIERQSARDSLVNSVL